MNILIIIFIRFVYKVGICSCIYFISFEFIQTKYYKKKFLSFFRKPLTSIFLFLITILFGFNSLELLYARI